MEQHPMERMAERLSSLPVEIRGRAYATRGISIQLQRMKESYDAEVAGLEMRYQNALKNFYEKRTSVITGSDQAGQTIPGFWLQCLLHNVTTSHMITTQDKAVLQHLTNISFAYIDNDITKGFVLNFEFESSEYFDACVLQKGYYQEFVNGEPILVKTVGSAIQWKSKDADVTQVRRRSSKRGAPGADGPSDSFFNFFNPPTIPEGEEADIDYEGLEIEIEMDYELGTAIKNQIIPFAVEYFVGERH